ncbi:MAG: hypothetical protein KDA24_08420 [Deltaproteobacteria bacterium]|nr:hypothetical protein [Deltaproteobacteria bacterium]
MVRTTLLALFVALPLVLVGCGEPTSRPIDCDLDSSDLSGQWVSLKGGGSGADVPDKFSRVAFVEKDGKKQAVYTAGQLAPGNPATNKYTYEFREITNLKEALFISDTMKEAGKSKQRIERLKKDNRRLDLKFEGRMYVSVNMKNCSLTIKDMYATWVRGEEVEDSNPSGVRTFIQNDYENDDRTKEFSMVHCDDVAGIYFFEKEEINLKDDEALNQKEGIYAKDDIWIHYLPALPEEQDDDEEKLKAAYAKKHITSTEGCTYDAELWMRDVRVEDKQKVPVTVAEDGKVNWKMQMAFQKSSADGVYVEYHRYKTCAGKREVVGNACTVAWPNRSRAEYEEEEKKAKAEEEAKKAAGEKTDGEKTDGEKKDGE